MLPHVFAFRDRYLKEVGIMIPGKARIIIARIKEDEVGYGITIKPPLTSKIMTPQITTCNKDAIVTEAKTLIELNLMTLQ
jgi:hypothetical protein